MNRMIAAVVGVWCFLYGAQAQDTTIKAFKATPDELPSGKAWLANASLEPYGTVAWQGLNGAARYGAGANVVMHINDSFSLWGFGESDNTEHSVVDRGGIGLRYEGNLGKHVKGDAGIAGGYGFEQNVAFVRLPVGLSLNVLKSKNFEAGLRAAYAFDISGNGKHGAADGRAFIGPTATLKW